LFLYCNIFSSLWQLVHNWIGFSSVDPQHIPNHFAHFAYSTDDLKAHRSFFFVWLIWLSCAWVLWNERNNKLFKNKEKSTSQLLDKVNVLSFWG